MIMMKKEIKQAIDILKREDKKYIKKILKEQRNEITYDCEYQGWCIGDKYTPNYFFNCENTYLNPKELESVIDEVIEEEIFPIKEVAEDFISYCESKWGLDNLTEDKISSKITGDAEFHIFEHMGLYEEVIKQLKAKGVEIND